VTQSIRSAFAAAIYEFATHKSDDVRVRLALALAETAIDTERPRSPIGRVFAHDAFA
jgi:hypothetical protein